MKAARSLLFACLALPAILMSSSNEGDIKEAMLRDLDFLRNVFEARYAPVEWKQKFSDWDLENEIRRAKADVMRLPAPTVKDYQRIVKRFCNSTCDYHVGATFCSTELATLPLQIAGAQGKFFITDICRKELPKTSFNLEVGDEVVLFDGMPTATVVDQLASSELAHTGSPTQRALAEMIVTKRGGCFGYEVPQGPVSLTVKSRRTGALATYQLDWNYCPELVCNPPVYALGPQTSKSILNHPFFNRQMITPLWNPMLKLHPFGLGQRESFVPTLGHVVWKSDDDCHFHAYVFRHPDSQRFIGYIRIPHYAAGVEEAQQFSECIAQLQRRSDALVIDQVNNPGGSAFYLYALASMLTDKPMIPAKHRMSLTQVDVLFAHYLLECIHEIRSDEDAREFFADDFDGYPIDYGFAQSMRPFFQLMIDEWNAGHRLTAPCYLYGADCIHPHAKVRYTKPILMLINALDFSGGDFLPALLQDHQRVTLFGERTAGAGGAVETFAYPNVFGMTGIHFTQTIAERLEGNPIENLGVTPEIPYVLTCKDLQEGYTGYARAVLNAVNDILRKKH